MKTTKKKVLVAAGIVFLIVAILAVPLFMLESSEDPSTAWTYQCPHYGFSLKLPSKQWQYESRLDPIATFVNRRKSSLFVVQGVIEKREEFFSGNADLKKETEAKDEDFLAMPSFAEGDTPLGNPYAMAIFLKQVKGNAQVFVLSRVWCREKNVTVRIDGHISISSPEEVPEKSGYFIKTAEAICFSVN
jgi:hypothetical protein